MGKRDALISERHMHAAFGEPLRPVVDVHRSPANRLRWCLTLSCGHGLWITAKRQPQRKTAYCERCGEEAVKKAEVAR